MEADDHIRNPSKTLYTHVPGRTVHGDFQYRNAQGDEEEF